MPITVHFNFKKESINHDISIDKNKSMIQCACNKNNKHEREVQKLPKFRRNQMRRYPTSLVDPVRPCRCSLCRGDAGK